jgi:hypothetical protein
MAILEALNNRELAILFWILIVFVGLLFQSETRRSLAAILKDFLTWKILASVSTMVLYVIFVVMLFNRIGLWSPNLLKDTIVWLLGTGFVLLLNISKVGEDEQYFRKALRNNITLLLVLEFIANYYTFSLEDELVLAFVVFIVIGMGIVAGTKEETRPAKRLTDFIVTAHGIFVGVFILHNVFTDFQAFASVENLRTLILLPLLTVFYLPFLYSLALISAYENFFLHLDNILKRDQILANAVKREILVSCNINLRNLNRFSKEIILRRVSILQGTENIASIIQELEEEAVNGQFMWRWIFLSLAIWNMMLYLKSS